MENKFYITTPIYYVNASPHIGHSYTTIAADTLARYYRGRLGKDCVLFLTGTDEHGQKIQKAAAEQGLTPQEFADKVVVQFRELWGKLGISYNDFIRTTEERHIKVVQKSLEILYKNEDIYLDKYEGWYCTPCETFWTKTQVNNQLCPDCQRPVEKISETNYFLKLSKYQAWLVDHINKNKDFIKPDTRRQEILSFLSDNQLNDLCISRPTERLSWGIPLTFSPSHVTYVWFDALINYISAVGNFDEKDNYVSEWWKPDVDIVHLIGKDILRQHAVYWPIILHALNIRLPDTVFAHGWWLIQDTKMSKSRGNVVSPLEMANKYGIDTYRYFLLRDVPFGLDGNFSEEAIIKRYNGDLANDLGNLLYRTLTMIEKYYDGNIPELNMESSDTLDISRDLKAEASFNFSAALEKIWLRINSANKHIEDTKPWNLAKQNKQDELKAFIRFLAEVIREVSVYIEPFMPRTSQSIREQIGQDKIKKGAPLFPRIEPTPDR